jgi:hypothetical protein
MHRRRSILSVLAVVHAALAFGQTQSSNVLLMLRDQTQLAGDHSLVEGHLKVLGGSGLIHYSAFPALSATLPPLTIERISADPNIAGVLAYPADSSRAMFDLLGQIDRAPTSSTAHVFNATLPDDAPDADPAFSQLLDRLIDEHHLTVVLRGGHGTLANAITVGPSGAPDAQKADFVGADSAASLASAIDRLNQAGVTDPLARKAMLINSAATTSGWSSDSGWGALSVDAVSALVDTNSGQAACIDQSQTQESQTKAPGESVCFTGSTANTALYETKSGTPAKLTLVWNRSFGSDGSPISRGFELHVYDHSHNELASAVSESGNVLQVTAASDSGLVIKVITHGPPDGSATPAKFALASSVQLQASTDPCADLQVNSTTFTVPPQGGTLNLIVTASSTCYWSLGVTSGQGLVDAAPNQITEGPGNLTIPLTAMANTRGVTLTEDMEVYNFATNTTIIPLIVFTQAPNTQTCTYTAATTGTLPIAATGGGAGISITASDTTCSSSVSNDSPAWLTLSSSSNSGSWTDGLTAPANVQLNTSSVQRTANVTVTGTSFSQSFSIAQAGLTCTYTVPSAAISVPSSGISSSQPQSFTVGVSNAACPWTASSSTPFIHVVNQGVTQSGKRSYAVPFWADANTGGAQRPGYAQVGDKIVDLIQGGDDPSIEITSPTDGQTFTSGFPIPVSWKYVNLAGDDAVKVSLSLPHEISADAKNNKQPAVLNPPATLAGKAGTQQAYTLTVKDTVKGTMKSITINLLFPLITVNYPPGGATVESRNTPDPINWTVTPAGAKIGDVTVQFGPAKGKLTALATVADTATTYKVTTSDLNAFGVEPGQLYQVQVVSAKFPNTGPSTNFTFSGIVVTKPDPGDEFANSGTIDIGWKYYGKAKNVAFSVSDESQSFPIGNASGTAENTGKFTVKRSLLGTLTLNAKTDANPAETDGSTITLDGININPLKAVPPGQQTIVVTWTSNGAKKIGPKCTVSLERPNNNGTVTSVQVQVDAGTASLKVNLPNPHLGNTAVYTVKIVTDSKYQTQTTLTVNGN